MKSTNTCKKKVINLYGLGLDRGLLDVMPKHKRPKKGKIDLKITNLFLRLPSRK